MIILGWNDSYCVGGLGRSLVNLDYANWGACVDEQLPSWLTKKMVLRWQHFEVHKREVYC
jgi:hypothetical protein